MGQCRKKREQLRVHGLLLLAYRLLRWPTIVTSRLPSSPAACFCPSGSRPFPLDFLLWGPFGHAATQVKFKPPRSKSASQNSSPPPSLPKIFGKKHFRKTDFFDKERAREKTRFSVQKKHQTKRHKKHVLNDRPVMAQNSMPSSLPEPQPARAADAAATTLPRPTHIPWALVPSPTPADPVPVTDGTATHTPTLAITGDTTRRHGDAPFSEHTAPAGHIPPPPLQAIAPQPHLPPLTLPPAQVLPTTLPRTQDHSSTSSLASPHLPRFHFLAHFRMGHRQVSNTLVEPIVGTPTAEPQYKPLGQAPPQHQQHRQLEQSGLATAAAWATTAPPIPACPLPLHPRRLTQSPLPALHLPNPPASTPWMTLKTWIPLRRKQSSTQTPTTGGLIYGEASWTQPRLTQCEFPRLGSWGSWARFQPWTSPECRPRPF